MVVFTLQNLLGSKFFAPNIAKVRDPKYHWPDQLVYSHPNLLRCPRLSEDVET